MTTQELKSRLREAVVVDERGFAEAAEGTITQLADPSAPGADALLGLARLAFGRPITDDARAVFDAEVAGAGLQLERRADQLRRVLGACVLVARFEAKRPRVSRASLEQDTLGALACRLLRRAGYTPIVPDLPLWVDVWLNDTASAYRSAGVRTKPPEFSLEPPPIDEALPPAAMVTNAFEAAASDLTKYTNELRDWAAQIDPAAVRAQREQIELMWWLSSARAEEASLVQAVLTAARELDSLTEFVPGPPAARELLARRIGSRSEELIRLAEIQSALASISMPASIVDLVTLHAAPESVDRREQPAADIATWVLEERQLIGLAAKAA